MDVKAVMDEIGTKLSTISGLRVFPYSADKVTPPGAIVGLPESIAFDQTYGRGSDSMTLPVFVMVSRNSDRAGSAELSAYLNGADVRSVKAAVDSTSTNTYTSCDTVTVESAEPGPYTSAGVELLGAEFTVAVTGSGS